MRWIMTLAEYTRPDVPQYAEDVAPDKARAVALVDNFETLFPVLNEWGRIFAGPIGGYAMPTTATDLDNLPASVLAEWEDKGTEVRLTLMPGGWVQVTDYREPQPGKSLSAGADLIIRA